jgi:hypothetical protein
MPQIKYPLLLGYRNTIGEKNAGETWRDFTKLVKPFLAKEGEIFIKFQEESNIFLS